MKNIVGSIFLLFAICIHMTYGNCPHDQFERECYDEKGLSPPIPHFVKPRFSSDANDAVCCQYNVIKDCVSKKVRSSGNTFCISFGDSEYRMTEHHCRDRPCPECSSGYVSSDCRTKLVPPPPPSTTTHSPLGGFGDLFNKLVPECVQEEVKIQAGCGGVPKDKDDDGCCSGYNQMTKCVKPKADKLGKCEDYFKGYDERSCTVYCTNSGHLTSVGALTIFLPIVFYILTFI